MPMRMGFVRMERTVRRMSEERCASGRTADPEAGIDCCAAAEDICRVSDCAVCAVRVRMTTAAIL